jgi:hypothetical protein
VILGALEYPNSVGYTYALQGALHLFAESSTFMRRVQDGYLTGECGHPKRAPGMTYDDYMVRVHTLEETNISHHISKVWLDYSQKHLHNGAVLIMGKVKPSGPMGAALREALSNPEQNVAFSIRSFTRDDDVRRIKYLDTILTWDWVSEPGLRPANKFASPALESVCMDLDVPLEVLLAAQKKVHTLGLGFESAQSLLNETVGSYQKAAQSVAKVSGSHTW